MIIIITGYRDNTTMEITAIITMEASYNNNYGISYNNNRYDGETSGYENNGYKSYRSHGSNDGLR